MALSSNTLPAPDRHRPDGTSSGDTIAALAPGLGLVGVGVVVATVLSAVLPVSTLVLAVVLGAAVGNVGGLTKRTKPGLTFATKRILRAGVVLLGLRLAVGDITALGPGGVAVVALTVTATFFGTQAIGRRMGLSRDLSLLVATGYSICGASAIAAVEGSTDADEEEVAVAIGLVTLFGSLAIVALPAMAGPLGLSDAQFGAWAGASVHDVAQVAATASAGGASVVAIAMVVKLTRVLLLTPIVIGVNVQRTRAARASDIGVGAGTDRDRIPPVMPLFVAGFLAMVMIRTTDWLPDGVIGGARQVEGVLFAAALIGLGSGVQFKRLRLLGPKPLFLGFVAWVLVAASAYVGVLVAF